MQTLEYCFTLFYPFANVMPSIERNCLMKLWSLLNRKAERENLKWWALVRQVSLGFLFELQREPWLFREKIHKLKHQCAEMPERRRRDCLTLPLHRKGACKLIICEHPQVFHWPLLMFKYLSVFENIWNLGSILIALRWERNCNYSNSTFIRVGNLVYLLTKDKDFFSDFPRMKVNILPQYLIHFILEALYEVSFAQITLWVR